MKKPFLAIAMSFAFTLSYASTEVVGKNVDLSVNPCTVTVTKYCEGSGTTISTTKTSPDGNCMAAATVANEQWNTDCKGATIQKAIKELSIEP